MENQPGKGITFEKFTWTIENFSRTNAKNLRSKAFKICGYKWKIYVYPLRKDVDHFSLYLMVADSLPPYGWTRNTYFKLVLINQRDTNKSVVKETQQKFNGGHRSWGSFFVKLSDFYDPKQGYLVKNTCIVEAHVCVSEVTIKIQESNFTKRVISINDSKGDQARQTEPTQPEDQGTEYSDDQSEALSSNGSSQTEEEARCSDLTLRDLIDFGTLGPEEAAFVPLLEEVCIWHPSLIRSQRNRTRWFKLWAFTSLGQVLHFLKTKKVKDMNEDGCKHLQGLWEELVKSSGFNLTWLEPYVQSALGLKAKQESEEKMKKLKDNVVALENKMKKLRGELAAAEMEFEVARRELVEGQKGYQEMDMNAELGYAMF